MLRHESTLGLAGSSADSSDRTENGLRKELRGILRLGLSFGFLSGIVHEVTKVVQNVRQIAHLTLGEKESVVVVGRIHDQLKILLQQRENFGIGLPLITAIRTFDSNESVGEVTS